VPLDAMDYQYKSTLLNQELSAVNSPIAFDSQFRKMIYHIIRRMKDLEFDFHDEIDDSHNSILH
jgi:hypothetical protein